MWVLKVCVVLLFSVQNGSSHLAQLAARLPLPGTPAKPGSPWPMPANHSCNPKVATISSRNFRFVSSVTNCDILTTAFFRYNADLLFRDLDVRPAINTPVLAQVQVVIPSSAELNLCGEYPRLNLDPDRNYERYEINITENGNDAIATITAWTVWGALHGIETFSQLIWLDENEGNFLVNFTEIADVPRFPHRGFMLDTARHYVDLPIIQSVLDGMAYNKLNIFHWHIVDDQSFPFVSTTFPELSQKGAYLPELTYEPEEVRQIMDYARDRGIRVVLEFDTPGHTQGFGKAFPDIITPCYGEGEDKPGTPNFTRHAAYEILDPTNNRTFEVMREFFTEIKHISKDIYVHLGMDEVYYACWESSPVIAKFMQDHNMTNISDVQQYYTERHLDMIRDLGLKSIIWHDPLEFGVKPEKDVLIQVWKGGNTNGTASEEWVPYMNTSVKEGYQTILSSCWYLNYISYGESWRKYYECDPIVNLTIYNPDLTEDDKKLILGGEAAYWAEYADSTNFLPRIFPFISPMAERLWSPEFSITKDLTDDAMHRLDQHRCRMLWRGLPAQPIFNGYCFAQEKTTTMRDNGAPNISSRLVFVLYSMLTMCIFHLQYA